MESVPFAFEDAGIVRFAESISKLPQVIPEIVHVIETGTVGGGVVTSVPASSNPTIVATTISRTPKAIELFFINQSSTKLSK